MLYVEQKQIKEQNRSMAIFLASIAKRYLNMLV